MVTSIAIIGVSFHGYTQPVVSIPSSAGCVGHELLVPINVEEFNDIEAFSFRLIGDTSEVELLGVTNENAALQNGVFVNNVQLNAVSSLSLSWVGNQPVHFDNETLFSARILIKDSTAEVTFEEPELVLSDYTIAEDAVFNDGNIVRWNNLNPEVSDNHPEIGEDITINVPLLHGLSYQWQIEEDDEWIDLEQNQWFEDTQTHQLKIKEVSEDLNNKGIRCYLIVGACAEVSETTVLNVQTIGFSELGEQPQEKAFAFYPNPVSQNFTSHFNKEFQNVSLKLVDMNGRIVKDLFLGNIKANESVNVPVDNLYQGFYVLKLYENESSLASYKFIKK